MARKPKRNQEAYTRLGFFLTEMELKNTNIERDDSVIGVTQELDQKKKKKKRKGRS